MSDAKAIHSATVEAASDTFLAIEDSVWGQYLVAEETAWNLYQSALVGNTYQQQADLDAAWGQFQSGLADAASAFSGQEATAWGDYQQSLQPGENAGARLAEVPAFVATTVVADLIQPDDRLTFANFLRGEITAYNAMLMQYKLQDHLWKLSYDILLANKTRLDSLIQQWQVARLAPNPDNAQIAVLKSVIDTLVGVQLIGKQVLDVTKVTINEQFVATRDACDTLRDLISSTGLGLHVLPIPVEAPPISITLSLNTNDLRPW